MAKQVVAVGDTGEEMVVKLSNNFDDNYETAPKVDDSSVTGILSTDLSGFGNIIEGNYSSLSGYRNEIKPFTERGLVPVYAFLIGNLNKTFTTGWAIGQANIADGTLAVAIGSACIASGNDSVAIGNYCVTGRRVYTPTSHGVDSLHGLGVGDKAFAIIDDAEGDVSTLFPATEVDAVPSVSKQFRLHPYCVTQTAEALGVFWLILKSEYTVGAGTKVWYDSDTDAIIGTATFMSSYAPILPLESGLYCGNSQFVCGRGTNASGYGSHAEGLYTKAWGHNGSHAEGYATKAVGFSSHAEGYETQALGIASHAEGKESKAVLDYQFAHAAGKFNVVGDAQYTRTIRRISTVGVGWHDFIVLSAADYGKSYASETLLVGKQFSTSNGMEGESCAYKFYWCCDRGTKHEYVPDDVDIENNKITVAEKLKTGTKIILESTGTLPAGLGYNYAYSVIYVDDTHIQLEDSLGSGAINITSQGSGTHSYSRWNFSSVTKQLIGRSFVNDGDEVGDGLTTGIVADLHQTYFGSGKTSNGNVRIALSGIATRSIRWVATTQMNEVM